MKGREIVSMSVAVCWLGSCRISPTRFFPRVIRGDLTMMIACIFIVWID